MYGIGDSDCYIARTDHASLEYKQIFGLSRTREENEKMVWKLKGA